MTADHSMRRYGHGRRIVEEDLGSSQRSSCRQTFGYLFPELQYDKTCILPYTGAVVDALKELGDAIGAKKSPEPDGPLPGGFTYFGQFVDHDVTFDPLSTFERPQAPDRTLNFRTPMPELDNLYGDGPADDPFLYVNNTGTPDDGVKLLLGTNTDTGPGGPASAGTPTDFDVPRAPSQVALIGDPRNDENLVVSQLHHAFLKLHNAVVDDVRIANPGLPPAQVLAAARRSTVHHYQWVLVEDFLKQVIDPAIVDQYLTFYGSPWGRKTIPAPGENFEMPVEFAMAAYRFGHSMIRDDYFVNTNFPNATLTQVFEFIRVPRLPVFSNWAVDFNRFFRTPANLLDNLAKQIDTNLSAGLDALPGESGIMAQLAIRNLLRGLAFGLPSGQAVAQHLLLTPLSAAEILQGSTAQEEAALRANADQLLHCTPLWYYALKEAEVREAGARLGAVGGHIVAHVFARMLAYDRDSILYSPGFQPTLGSSIAELLDRAGVL